VRHEIHCPVASTIALIGGKWKPSILLQMKDGPCHFNELRRRLPHITQRVLTLQLRAMEADGIITRRTGKGNPPTMNYSISKIGMTLGPALQILEDWGRQNLLASKSGTMNALTPPRSKLPPSP
jgi:DNA-binding HxlR family transcriptional regulator